jgi:FSR family fosmidomycin resistance protein-like MFS transporter
MFALAHIMQHIYTFVLPPLLPIFKTAYDLSYFQTGLLPTMLSVGLTTQLVMGIFSDRIGKRVVFVSLGLISTAVLVGVIGLTDNYPMLVAVTLLIGAAASAYHPAGTTLITEYYSDSSRGKVLGLHSIGDSLGPGISPILIGALTAMLSWQSAVYLLAVPGVLIGLIYWKVVRDVPAKHSSNKKQPAETENIGLGSRPIMTNLIVILVAMFFTMLVSVGMIVFFSLYLVDVFKISQPFASLLLGILFISGMPGGLIGGWASDKFGRRSVSLLSLAAGPILVVCCK